MVKRGAIEAAIKNHEQWKIHLYDAIRTGESAQDVNAVRKDNICLFGQWINNLAPQEMESEHFKNVKELHTEFHQVAADILNLAITGKRDEALKRMLTDLEYDNISNKMTEALNAWKEKLKL